MAKKRIMKIPSFMILRCPLCSKKSKAKVSIDICPQSFVCPKCNAEVKNNLMNCCVICAYSGKKCPRTLYMEARVKGLELR
jgi:hypothetical protein